MCCSFLDRSAICTGTFINDYQVVSAAHCVEGVEAINIYERNGASGFNEIAKATSFKAHPQYVSADNTASYDVSVITFPANSSSYTSKVALTAPKAGDKFTIVGFGNNVIERKLKDGQLIQTGSTYKRKGTNVIKELEDGQILFKGYLSEEEARAAGVTIGSESAAAGGDSGGPMFDEQGDIIGVTSHGRISADDDGNITEVITSYVDLTSSTSVSFLNAEVDKP